MRRACQVALAVDAQGLTLDTAQALQQQAAMGIVVQQLEAAFELIRHGFSFLEAVSKWPWCCCSAYPWPF
jgi:hypothetical protein